MRALQIWMLSLILCLGFCDAEIVPSASDVSREQPSTSPPVNVNVSDDGQPSVTDVMETESPTPAPPPQIVERTWIPCNDYQICTELDRSVWKSKRAIFRYIMEAKLISFDGILVEKDSRWVLALENRTRLCEDTTSAAFLMDFFMGEASDDWPMACLWGAGTIVGACAPAPPSTGFTYISPEEWSTKVKAFRAEIGCSTSQQKAAEKMDELFICRENCLDIGLTYYHSLCLTLGILLFIVSMTILNME